MTGHLAFPRIIGNLTPASLSPYFLKVILRGKLGFRGIVITDDMEMEGVLDDGTDTAGACRRALEAGNDMVLISHTPATEERTWKALRAALRTQPAFRSVLLDSVKRIVAEKLRAFRASAGPLARSTYGWPSLRRGPRTSSPRSRRAPSRSSAGRESPSARRRARRSCSAGSFPSFSPKA